MSVGKGEWICSVANGTTATKWNGTEWISMSVVYGSDNGVTKVPCVSNGTSCVTCNQQPADLAFYLGNIGGGTQCGNVAFNESYATQVIANGGVVYAVWNVWGPKSDPQYSSTYTSTQAQAWGSLQGQQFVHGTVSNPTSPCSYSIWQMWKTYITSHTVWADIETNESKEGYNPGWLDNGDSDSDDSPNWKTLNHAVLKGFISYLLTQTAPDSINLSPGVYSSKAEWTSVFGSVNASVAGAYFEWAVWTSQNSSVAPTMCPSSIPSDIGFGGKTPDIAQYYVSGTDYDVANV